MPASHHRPPLGLPGAVGLLALTQTLGYGTVFYSYAGVAPAMAREFGAAPTAPFTVISLAFLLSGLAAPRIGRLIDRIGGPRVMQAGSVVVALIYLALALAPGFAIAALLVVLLQIASVMVLYGAAFPTLARFGGERAKRGMIWLGLVGGFASTIFWPLTGWLVPLIGWRWVFGVFALMHLLLALPAHRLLARRRIEPLPGSAAPVAALAGVGISRRFGFWLLALSFGLTGIVSTALLVHMVPLLSARGLGSSAYLAAAMSGPAMALARATEVLVFPKVHPIWPALIAALCFPLALLALLLPLPALAAGFVFAGLYGIGHGLAVTSSGTLPLRIFGNDGYAEILGRIGAVRVVMSAGGPALFAAGIESGGLVLPLSLGIGFGLLSVLPLLVLLARLRPGFS